MDKLDINKEITELIVRFRRLQKAIKEEQALSPAQQAAKKIASTFKSELKKAAPNREAVEAQRLAAILKDRNILGSRPPPRQPTDEEMFGHLIPSEEQVQKAENDWGNSINNWMTEATKPISSRFKNAEEEQAYWDSLKINDSGAGNGGY